jgi:hypothetical protein
METRIFTDDEPDAPATGFGATSATAAPKFEARKPKSLARNNKTWMRVLAVDSKRDELGDQL